jgi:uncharacterized protein (TIGR02246 family)
MRRRTWIAVMVIAAVSAAVGAQTGDVDAKKLAADYEAAYNRGDSKALTALYTPDAIRLGPDGQMIKGRQAIEKAYVENFGAASKGAQLSLQVGGTQVVSPDVRIMDGRYSTTGANPVKGRYVNTVVRTGSTWLLASVVTVPDSPAMK